MYEKLKVSGQFEEEKNYIKLIETLIKIGEANKGTNAGADKRFLDAEGLCKKFIGHAASALYLFRNTTLQDVKVTNKGISFFDTASINVLGRAALESFLVFHYVFIASKTADDKDFRYYSWFLANYLERQKFPAQSEEGKNQLDDEKKIIDDLKTKINNNSVFKQLKEKKKGNLLKGEWRLQSWMVIGDSAGLSKIIAKQFYGHLCNYAHSGCKSAQQVENADTAETQKALCVATMTLIMIAMANMINAYCQVFKKSNDVLEEDVDAKNIVGQWVAVGRGVNSFFC